MTKFHINKHGVPAPCRAKKGNCPLGGDSGTENHFDNVEDAQRHADEMFKEKYGLTGVQGWGNEDLSEKSRVEINAIYGYLDNEGVSDLIEYDDGDSDYGMENQLKQYSEAIMRKYNGENVDLEKEKERLSMVWTEEADNADYSSYDFDSDSSFFSSGENYGDDAKIEALDRAEDTAAAFYERAELLDEVYSKVDRVDWESNGDSKQEALDRVLDYAYQAVAE